MEVKTVEVWAVDILESERGWGNRIDDTRYFETKQQAQEFVKEYNKDNNPLLPVPDWYMIALEPRKARLVTKDINING